MSQIKSDIEAYKFLCEAISKNESLQVIHYGCTYKDLEEITEKINNGSGEQYPMTSSPFTKDTRPVAYYYPHDKVITGTASKSKKIGRESLVEDEVALVFELNDHSHGLTGFTIANLLPSVVANDGYQVRWCHNIGSHIVRYGIFSHGKTIIHDFDDVTSDILLTYPQRGEDLDSINVDLGNISELQSFSKNLPQKQTIFVPSFPFCSNDTSDMFPLYMCAHADEITATLILKTNPQSLLIIAREIGKANDFSLEIIAPAKGKKYARFFEGQTEMDSFSYPTAVAHYAYMSQDECSNNWCKGEGERKTVSFYVNQAIPFSSKNPVRSSNTTIEKITTQHVVTSIAWMAQQQKCRERHIYSNYTTNPTCDFLTGISPIVETSISNGTATLLDKAPAILTNRITPRFSNRKSPVLPGIHLRSFGIRSTDNSMKPGFIFTNGGMDFNIRESDPLVISGDRDETDDSYTVEARLFCRLPFIFTSFAQSEDQRISMDKSIIALMAQ